MQLNQYSHNAFMVVYHSINEYCEDRIRVPNIVTPAVFEEQIKYLASTARIINFQEYLDHVKEGKPLLDNSIVVTFDDGYKDNLTNASPILRKYGVPATFFITTGCIGTGKMKWEDQLSCLVRRSKVDVIFLSLPPGDVSLRIVSDKDKFKVIGHLVSILGHLHQAERLEILDKLEKQLKVKCEDQDDLMMTWDEVRELANTPGFSIGSHSVTHQHLTRIPVDNMKYEVKSSKEHLENETGCSIIFFSYPYGDYDHDVITAVKNAGYNGAVTIEYGQNSIRRDLFRLKRVLVPNQRGLQFTMGLQLRTSIFGELLRNSYNTINNLNRKVVY